MELLNINVEKYPESAQLRRTKFISCLFLFKEVLKTCEGKTGSDY